MKIEEETQQFFQYHADKLARALFALEDMIQRYQLEKTLTKLSSSALWQSESPNM